MTYHFKVSNFDLTEKNLSWAQDVEREKIKRFYHEIDKKRSLIGHLMARFKLGKLLQKDYDQIQFKRTYEGKPYLENSDIYFNISHSGYYVVLVVSNFLIGIDIEQMKEITDIRKVFSSIFSEKELDFITQDKNLEKKRFYIIWTLKESFIKCVGKGLSYKNLNQLNIIIKNDFKFNNIDEFFTFKKDFDFDDQLFIPKNWNESIELENFPNFHFYLFEIEDHIISISIKETLQQI